MTEITEQVEVVEAVPEQQEQPEQQTALATGALNYLDSVSMNKAFKVANYFAKSDLLPESYRDKPANVLIAMDLASRMGMSLSLVAQNLYIVRGRPGWSGQFCIAAINGCGKFSPLRFIEIDEGGGGCYAVATRLKDGEVCESPKVTIQLAKDEGWYDKSGSKWKTGLAPLMARYRAAAFFARLFCPEVLAGLQTAEEIQDVRGEDKPKETIKLTLNS